MSDLKTKQVFEQPLSDNPSDIELTAQVQFESAEKFVPVSVEEPQIEQAIADAVKPKGKGRWLFGGIAATFLALVGWQGVDSVVTALQAGDWLGLGWGGFIAALSALGGSALAKEWWKLRRLKQRFSTQEQAVELLESDQLGKAKPFCQQLAKQSELPAEHTGYERWINAVNSTHSDQEVLTMYDSFVLETLDQKAKKLIAKSAGESALLVAISPLAIADMLLVAWRNLKLVNDLANLYGVELGYWSRIRLLKLVFVNMAAAGATELVADASMDLLSMDLAGKLSTRAAQGLGVGLLTARLGLKAVQLVRPLPWQKDKQIKIGEIRSSILQRLKPAKNDA
ncbi:TIGR01620 family protein [Vibrio sp. SCSIO 43136]|uniref:YcjF family protein n=1 Tax=Vibrio sp. SCSIO 43136 TaxID=2819101 RepID=UPI002074D9B2|nr:TIGR01620 family protein [Vibrio sp. SCSIO 43136]USD66441.1 TIGR01620 family protein [Vibrio sp. SCSIO 43136]